MKCYYEELDIQRDADESDIKTAYRKLALKWHPDKNPNCVHEAKERFQLIQQAYEVLSDPQERSWYDKHREQILRGKGVEYEDNCLDVFQYFSVSCFKGYGDDDKGFYTVYREVFKKITTEDAEFMDDAEELENIPRFGDSKSGYEEVVGPFYAYWSVYCTKRTYTWLCPYDIKLIKDRRILREIEKDMKKLVQKAKKERNEEVRSLVAFIRKRDKRVQANKKLLEERAAFNRQKQEQNRLEQIRRRQQDLEEMIQNSQTVSRHNDDYEEQLKQLELQYSSDDEYYDEDEEELIELNELSEEIYTDELYCVTCNREFKTENAFFNHETSKKHCDNVEKLKITMRDEETLHQSEIFQKTKNNGEELPDEDTEGVSSERRENSQVTTLKNKPNKSKNKKYAKKLKQPVQINSDEDINEEKHVEEIIGKIDISSNDDNDWNATSKKSTKRSKNKSKTNKNNSILLESHPIQPKSESQSIHKNLLTSDLDPETTQHVCATCKSKFESKNKLFCHLKLTNHGVYISKTKVTNDESTKSKKTKGKRK